MSLPQILQQSPSHFNWDLESGTSKDFEALNLQISEHIHFNPTETPIQALLFQSYLYMSGFKHPRPDFNSFKACMEKAYEQINSLTDEDEKSGYQLVAKSNEAIVARRLKTPNSGIEDELEDLMDQQTERSKACVNSVRAFALSRMGLAKYQDTEYYYQQAVSVYPDKTDWLFGLALVLGRQARQNAPPFTFTDEMVEEKSLLEKILELDGHHALAHATLSQCLLLKKENQAAIEHAKKAVENDQKNPYILSMAGKVFRRTKQYDDAIGVFQQACKLNSDDTFLHHQHGLVYRDKYNDQIEKKALKEPPMAAHEGNSANYDKKDKNNLREALKCFTKAVKGNSTNTMALLDKARAHADLGELEEADEDFNQLIATDNLSHSNTFTFNYRYALFLREKLAENKKAAKHLRTAIGIAVTHCTKVPMTRDKPTPTFKGITKDFHEASKNFCEIMDTFLNSADRESQTEGLNGLGWLHQSHGEHEAAREKYEAYLKCDGKSKDYKVIQQLISCFIQLDELEEARKQIESLKKLKPRLWEKCHIDCILREGELLEQTDSN